MNDSTVVRQQSEEEYTNDKTDEQREFERQERLQLFGSGLYHQFSIQVGLKEEIEQSWLDSLRHYNGRYDRETEANLSKKTDKSKSSRIVVNLTRAKTNIGESKLSDLVLPTDDRNWGIKPTPVPELAQDIENEEEAVLADGSTPTDPDNEDKPYTKADIAKQIMAEAKKRAEAMQDEIDDQLTECSFNTKCREVIHDACLLGIGILKGPMIKSGKNKSWIEKENNDWQLGFKSNLKPTADRVDPWNFFPDMSAVRQEDWEFTYERHLKTKKQMRKLASQPGYMPEQIKRVLQMQPNARGAKLSYLNELREMNGISQIQHDNRYELLEYRGPISKNDLIACGCEHIDLENNLEEYEGVVWFVDGIVIKVGLNHMDDDAVMYSVLNWESDEVSVFGFGIPFRMRNPQKVMNASWRMVLDNAGLSTGPQILINRELVEPADGNWTLSPRKVWWMKTKDPKFRADYAMQTFKIDSQQAELTNIFQIAKQLADEETSLPQMNFGGMAGDQQQPAAMKTLGGTQLWMTSNSIPMRRAVKNWDDYIIRPFITRFYDWNMQFNDKPEIKGDYRIDARGTSVLLVKEIQSQNMTEFVNTAMALPGGADELDVRGVLEQSAKSLQLSGNNLLKEKGEASKEKENQPPDPEILKLQAQKEMKQMEIDAKREQSQQEANIKMTILEGERQIALINREVELSKVASGNDIKMQDIRSKAGIKKYDTDWKIRQFYEELKQKKEQGNTSNYGLGD